MIFISCHTDDDLYTGYARQLEQDFKTFGLSYHIESYMIRGSWFRNTHYKPIFIKKMLLKFKQPVVWIDADTRILKEPTLFSTLSCDMAAYYDKCLCSATMYFDYNNRVLKVIDEWIAACDKFQHKPDDTVFDTLKHDLKVTLLPESYCKAYRIRSVDTEEPVLLSQHAHIRAKLKMNAVRITADGNYVLLRQNAEAIKYLNRVADRLDERTWKPKSKDIIIYKDTITGPVNIVGRGKSLDRLKEEHLQNLPTFWINDSCYLFPKYRQSFCVVQDSGVLKTKVPCTVFCSQDTYLEYSALTDHILTCPWRELTAITALRIAKMMGASKARLLAFDACVGEGLGYSNQVTQFRLPSSRFLNHCDRIRDSKVLEFEYVSIPTSENTLPESVGTDSYNHSL